MIFILQLFNKSKIEFKNKRPWYENYNNDCSIKFIFFLQYQIVIILNF